MRVIFGFEPDIGTLVLKRGFANNGLVTNNFFAIVDGESDGIEGGGDDGVAVDIENFAGGFHSGSEGTVDFFEGSEEEIAEGMTLQTTVFETIIHESAEFLRLGKCDEALTDIAGRKNAEFVAKFAGRTAVVGH